MRRWSALVALLLFLPLPASAQDTQTLGEPIRVLDDPTGDYYASLENAYDDSPGIQDPVPYYTFMDMDWLDVTETDEGFLFTLKVVDIEGPLDDASFSDGGFFWIHFRHNDWDYQLQIERPSGQTEIEYFAILQSKYVDADEWGFLWRDDSGVEFSIPDATISYFVERADLADGRGAAPYPGRSLTDFWVVASQRSSQAEADFEGETLRFPWKLGDRMPDTGFGTVSVEVQSGLHQTGGALLLSDEPYRASNGEATTFLYTVTARNDGPSTDLFNLETVDVPSSWNVEVPLAGVQLGAGEGIQIPVLVTTPFAHQHGGTQEFLLEMRSTTDPDSIGRIELGIRYLEIPQPAGHHDYVFLHSIANTQTASFNSVFAASFQPSGSMYFNTYEEDPSSDEVPVSAFSGLGTADFTWLISLDPTLRMGLDFDMESLGETFFEITSPGPMEDASMTGAFILRQAGSDFSSFQDAPQLATFEASGLTWEPQDSKRFELPITPLDAGDYVPYSASNELWLMIQLSGTGVSAFNQNTVPSLQADGWFRLPLNEYQDDISDAFDALSGARMNALTASVRDANPGDVLLFDVGISAESAAAGDYRLALIGAAKDWGQIVGDDVVSVSGTPATVIVLVQVPEDADDGDRADLFLQATHTIDPQRRGLQRLTVDVDTDQEWDDDFAAAAPILGIEDEKGSPAPTAPALLALVAAALVARRRRD